MADPHDPSVLISVPPRTEFIALLRTVTAGVATRMQLSLDAMDDLRLAVDEAVALLLTAGHTASRIEMRLVPSDTELTAIVGIDSPIETWPPQGYQETLSWQVILGLTDDAHMAHSEQGMPTITFAKRTLAPRPA